MSAALQEQTMVEHIRPASALRAPLACGAERPPAIRPLSALSRDDLAFAGELGVRLAGQVRAGQSVAPGFVVGAPAFRALCDAGLLCRRLAVTLADLYVADPERLMAAAALARSFVIEQPVPAWLSTELHQSSEALLRDAPDATLVVRASSTEPGLPPLSMGSCDSVIDVRGADGVEPAVRQCWASPFDARRVFERARRGLSQVDLDVAVVVQRVENACPLL